MGGRASLSIPFPSLCLTESQGQGLHLVRGGGGLADFLVPPVLGQEVPRTQQAMDEGLERPGVEGPFFLCRKAFIRACRAKVEAFCLLLQREREEGSRSAL